MKTTMMRYRLGRVSAVGVALLLVMVPAFAGLWAGRLLPAHAQRQQTVHQTDRRQAARAASHTHQAVAPPALTTVPSNVLQGQGVKLESPDAAAAVARDAALARLLAAEANESTVRETVLARVLFRGQKEQDGQLYWVVSLMPSSGTKLEADSLVKVSYMVAFVSATSSTAPMYILTLGDPIPLSTACCAASHPAIPAQP